MNNASTVEENSSSGVQNIPTAPSVKKGTNELKMTGGEWTQLLVQDPELFWNLLGVDYKEKL